MVTSQNMSNHSMQNPMSRQLYYSQPNSNYWDWFKNIGNYFVKEVGNKFSPPPEKDVFLINGELSPN